MNLIFNIVFIFFVNFCNQGFKDSAGIYISKIDFDKNVLSYTSPYRIKEKFGPFDSDFDYMANGNLILKRANKKKLIFKPGEVYGFLNEGKKYLYIQELKKYLVVVNESPVVLLIKENTMYLNHYTHTDLYLYYLTKDNQLKEVNNKNLNQDFDTSLQSALKEINMDFGQMKRKYTFRRFDTVQFTRKCKEIFTRFIQE